MQSFSASPAKSFARHSISKPPTPLLSACPAYLSRRDWVCGARRIIEVRSKGYIPFKQKGIYLSSKRYIPHDSEVYSSRRRGIVLQKKRYIPSEQRVYTFRLEVILLPSQCYITFRQKLYYFSPKPIGAANEGTIEPSSKGRSRASEVRSSGVAK